ncbi:MAG: 2-hydroxychromene-2-carboxylate isomerase [Pararhodobacter sp.]
MKIIEFWFDFSSPYAYFASLEIESLARKHDRMVVWRPLLLGRAFQLTGMQSLSQTPIRGDYARRDWARTARRLGVPFRVPSIHPIVSTTPSRAFLWIEEHQPNYAAPFARSVFKALYVENRDVRDANETLSLADGCGVNGLGALEAALPSEDLNYKFRQQTESGIARGVFGSPFFFVDGEPFWGHDRMPLIDDWLSLGGW